MRKKLLITIYDMEIGGIERSLINMLECMDYERYQVDVLVFSHKGDFYSLLPSPIQLLPEERRLTVYRSSLMACVRGGHIGAAIIRIFARMLSIAKANRERFKEGGGYVQMQLVSKYYSAIMPSLSTCYDAAISYAWPHDYVLRRVNARKKIAWIHTDYSQLEIDNELDYQMWKPYDHIASISEACTKAFLSKYPNLSNRIVQIENINSPSFIKRMATDVSEELAMDPKVFKLLTVGRLSFVKGFDLAIHALKQLKEKGLSHVKWYVIGYGGYESALRELIRENGLEEEFILLGKKVNPYPYMAACDLYVQPSRYEGKAVTVTEAQILGKPVMITNYSTASSQVLHQFNGYISELSVEGIAEGIALLHNHPDIRSRLADNCRKQDFGNSSELDRLYALIDQDGEVEVDATGERYCASI